MGKFLGELGGFLMILLIGILLTKFLYECHFIKKEQSFLSFRKISLFVVGMGMLYLIFGGLFYNFSVENSVSIAQSDKIWNYGSYADTLSMLGEEQGSTPQGLFIWIYVHIVNLFGKIFFEQYTACSFYTSFICSVLAIWLFFCGLKRIAGEGTAWYFVTMILVLPYSFRLFLPSSASLILLVAAAIFYCIIHFGKFAVISKLDTFSWRNFLTECIWLMTCIVNAFILYRDIVVR